MAIDLVIPQVGESITEVEVGEWLKQEGDHVEKDEAIVEIESDKATVEIFAPVAGTVTKIAMTTGTSALIGDVVGAMEAGEASASAPKAAAAAAASAPAEPAASGDGGAKVIMPAAQRIIDEKKLNAADIPGSGKGGRVTKGDVLSFLENPPPAAAPGPAASGPAAAAPSTGGTREEDSVRMTPMRRAISANLVAAQQNAALLTTFNEVDMTETIALRSQFKDLYAERYGVRLGFMSFFVKACVDALKTLPSVNAEVREDNIVYKNFFDIGIAVGGAKGLVVPVLRNAERMSFAEIESGIGDFGRRARATIKLNLRSCRAAPSRLVTAECMGSLLSTPIVNSPQSAILGMHKIEQRPMVVDGEIVARPMMYLALTYDHRVVDGREAGHLPGARQRVHRESDPDLA